MQCVTERATDYAYLYPSECCLQLLLYIDAQSIMAFT